MMTSNDVREVSFAKSVSGYNRDEVDTFLDKVEEDYKKYEAYVKTLQEQVTALNNEAAQYKASSDSLQTVLVSAQQLADKIIEEAKQKAAAIEKQSQDAANEATAEAKEMLADFDQKLAAKRVLAEKQMAKDIEKSKKEQEGIKLVTDEIIRKQQASFDRLKIEIAEFKKNIIGQYKDQLELIAKLPDDIVMDAGRVAKAIEYEIENEPEEEPVEEPVPEPETEPEPAAETAPETKQTPEEILKIDPEEIETEMNEGGFVISFEDDEEGAADDSEGFANDFFNQNK